MATSTLNPNAPIFVPLSYRKVEDFSDEWWDLVRSSPYFRDYWLRECFSDPQNPQNDNVLADFNFSFPEFDVDDLFDPIPEKEEVKKGNTDLVSVEVLKWQMGRMVAEMPKYAEKVPKIVKMKGGPRLIQQPR